jgi:hypothetical protein
MLAQDLLRAVVSAASPNRGMNTALLATVTAVEVLDGDARDC